MMPQSPYFYAILGKCSIGVMQTLVKCVSHTLSSFQILLVRSICIVLISWYLVRRAKISPYVHSKQCIYVPICSNHAGAAQNSFYEFGINSDVPELKIPTCQHSNHTLQSLSYLHLLH